MQKQTRLKKQDILPLWLRIIGIIVLAFIIVVTGIPMLNVLSVSLSSAAKSDSPGLILFPSPLTSEGYSFIWNYTNLKVPFFNTVLVAVVGTLLHVFFSSLAGYVLAQDHLPFKKTMVSFVMLTMMIPSQLSMIGIYVLNKQLHLLNTYQGLIINGMVTGFSVFLMKNYFEGIPRSLAESARLEGASEFTIFNKIYMRLSLSGFMTIGTLEFIRKWNDITMTITLISDMKKWTLPVVLRWLLFDQAETSGTSYVYQNAKMAAVVITSVPLIVLYFFTQNFFKEGALVGSVKG
jgi:putative aldouronate transport system permease protein